jgi:hypothetical protein
MYMMRRYTVSKARERFAAVLDEADRTGSVMIEPGGSQYIIRAAPPRRRQPRTSSVIEILDPAVERGEWTWDLTPRGVRRA